MKKMLLTLTALSLAMALTGCKSATDMLTATSEPASTASATPNVTAVQPSPADSLMDGMMDDAMDGTNGMDGILPDSTVIPESTGVTTMDKAKRVIEQIEDLPETVDPDDEENILLTLHARNVSNAKVITKINRINFRNAINTLDLGSVLYPRYITSEAIVAYVRAKHNSMNSNVETLNYLCDNRVEAVEIRVNEASAVTGTMLKDLKPRMKKDILIASINRKGKILIPSGVDTIEVGDTVMVVTTHSGFNDILDILA